MSRVLEMEKKYEVGESHIPDRVLNFNDVMRIHLYIGGIEL